MNISAIIKWLERLEDLILIFLLLTMIFMAVLQIILRNTIGSGIAWGDTMVRILVLWAGLVGAMAATRQNSHINIDVVTRYLSIRAVRLANAVTMSFTAAVCLLTSWFSLDFVRMEFEFKTIAFATVPAWVCQCVIPFAFLVIAIRCLGLASNFFRRFIYPE